MYLIRCTMKARRKDKMKRQRPRKKKRHSVPYFYLFLRQRLVDGPCVKNFVVIPFNIPIDIPFTWCIYSNNSMYLERIEGVQIVS